MKNPVHKPDSCLAVGIPQSVCEQSGIEKKDPAGIDEQADEINKRIAVIPEYSLSELCSRIKPENVHDEIPDEAPAGKEYW